MGCDIHLYVEARLSTGKWAEIQKNPRWCHDCNGTGKREGNPCYHCDGTRIVADGWYTQRNYALFGVLAGIRGGTDPISQTRGPAPDHSKSIAQRIVDWDVDGHSHTWYYLSELLDYRDRIAPVSKVFDDLLTELQNREHEPENIRVVMWFDN